MAVVVAIILPLASTAKKAEVKPSPRERVLIDVVAKVDCPGTLSEPSVDNPPAFKTFDIDTLVVEALPRVTKPVKLIPPVPALRLRVVVPVVLPTFIVLAVLPLPRLTVPVVPESRIRLPVVPEVTFKFEPVAEDKVRVLLEVRAVAPVPVKVADVVAMVKRVLLEVMKLSGLASVVPRVVVVPKPLPPLRKAVLVKREVALEGGATTCQCFSAASY